MNRFVLVSGLVLFAMPARAADQPVYAPAADWVSPQEMPKVKTGDTAAPTRILLQNMQVRFTDDARETFVENIYKIQTPQGLSAAGNLALSWSPDTDILTIHKLKILRGDQTIDLLSGGHAFTVLRRENNLEMAMLDGALTAAVQPEGLQVGDILDFSFTLRKSDPVMQGHAEVLAGNLAGAYADKSSIRMVWPKAKKLRWRQAEGLVPAKITSTKYGEELSIEMNDVQPVMGPKGAPTRYFELGELEGTEFQSWADISALMAPLYQKAAAIRPDSPLKAEAVKIMAASTDPKTRAMAALKLVEDQIRYLFLGMNNGGYVPTGADETWSRRFGDCKGKTAILLALLHEMGIEGEPALASVIHGDGLDERLPMLEIFDHVLVRAVIGGKVYWLDGTRVGDRNLDDLPLPGFHWLLPVQPTGATLAKVDQRLPDKPLSSIELQLDASGGLDVPAPVHAIAILREDAAIVTNLQVAKASQADLEKYLKDYWKGQYDGLEITKVDAVYDIATGEERFSMDGSLKMEWKTYSNRTGRQYETDGGALGWKAEFDRDPGPNQKAPVAVAYPFFAKTVESIRLPNGGTGFSVVGGDVDKIVAAREFKRTSKIENGVFTMEASTKSLAREFPFSETPVAKEDLRALWDVTEYVVAPSNIDLSPIGVNIGIDGTPTTVEEFVRQAGEFIENKMFDRAMTNLNIAAAMRPDSAVVFTARGIAYLWMDDLDRATSDFDRAEKLDPKQSDIYMGRGLLERRRGDERKSIELFTRALEINSSDIQTLIYRLIAYRDLYEVDKSIADCDTILKLDPSRTPIYLERATAYIMLRQGDKALVDADKVLATEENNAEAHGLRGAALKLLGRKDEAADELDRSIKLKPTVEAYLERAQLHSDDADKGLADANRAIELDSKSSIAFVVRAAFYGRKGDLAHAIADADQAVALAPDDVQARSMRMGLFAKNHQYDLALKDSDFMINKLPDNPALLNNRCWFRAQAGKDLSAALADCDASLKLKDLTGTRDSRGFVYLRLGRFDDAISEYNTALASNPKLAPSLFGRGIAKLRKGAVDDGQADLAAARAANPKIEAEFSDYGVKP
jgi:tetratricopeptide (TPR) repeat protein